MIMYTWEYSTESNDYVFILFTMNCSRPTLFMENWSHQCNSQKRWCTKNIPRFNLNVIFTENDQYLLLVILPMEP